MAFAARMRGRGLGFVVSTSTGRDMRRILTWVATATVLLAATVATTPAAATGSEQLFFSSNDVAGGQGWLFDEFGFRSDDLGITSATITIETATNTFSSTTSEFWEPNPGVDKQWAWNVDNLPPVRLGGPLTLTVERHPSETTTTWDAPNGLSVRMDRSGGTAVAGTASPGEDVRVMFFDATPAPGTSVERTLTPAADGTWSTDLAVAGSHPSDVGTLSGTFDQGGQVWVEQTLVASDGTRLELGDTDYLPSVRTVTTQGDATTARVDVFGVDPSLPLMLAGSSLSGSTTASRGPIDVSGGATVTQAGATLAVPAGVGGVTSVNTTSGVITGTSYPNQDVYVDWYDGTGSGSGTTTANGAGTWTFDTSSTGHPITMDTLVASYHNAPDLGIQTDRHRSGPAAPHTVQGGANARVYPQADQLNVDGLDQPPSQAVDVQLGNGGPVSVLATTVEQLVRGVHFADFSPPVTFTGTTPWNMDINLAGGGAAVVSSLMLHPLSGSLTTPSDGTWSGSTTPGADVYVETTAQNFEGDSGATTADGSGDWFVTLGRTAQPQDTTTMWVTDFQDSGYSSTQFYDPWPVREAAPIVLGAAGGAAYGFGQGLVAFVEPGGASDLTVQFLLNQAEAGTFAYLPPHVGFGLTFPFGIEVLEGGTAVSTPSTEVDLAIPIRSDLAFPTVDLGMLNVGFQTGSGGWQTVPAANVTICADLPLPANCPVDVRPPFAFVDDVPHFSNFAVFVGNPSSDSVSVERVAGDERIATAIELSQEVFADGSVDTAIVADAFNFPDALAAAPLAAAEGGPVLLNRTGGLDPRVEAELDRLGVDDVHLMGGVAAQSREVSDELAAAGFTVNRLAGSDRFATAALAANEAVDVWQADGHADAGDDVIIALGAHPEASRAWPDALAAGQLAGHARRPILLVTPSRVPDVTQAAIDGLGADRLTIVGGEGAIPPAVADAAGDPSLDRDRIGGVDRYETALLLAGEAFANGGSQRDVFVATGRNFPDALGAAPAAVARGGLLVMVARDDLAQTPAVDAWFTAREAAVRWVRIAGGAAVIDAQVLDDIADRL